MSPPQHLGQPAGRSKDPSPVPTKFAGWSRCPACAKGLKESFGFPAASATDVGVCRCERGDRSYREGSPRNFWRSYQRHASVEGALAHCSCLARDRFRALTVWMSRSKQVPSQAIRSNVEAITASLGAGWSKRQLIDRFVLGSRQPPIVGSAEQVADQLIAWVMESDVDGFQSLPHRCPRVFWRVSSIW